MGRKFVIWVVLIIMFTAFYEFFGGLNAAGQEWRWRSAVPIVFVAAFGFFFWLNTRGHAEINRAAQHINAGRHVAALATLDAITNRSHIAVPFNRGVASRCLWRLDDAVKAFEIASQHEQRASLSPRIEQELQLARVLRGDQVAFAQLDSAAGQLAAGVRMMRKQTWNDALTTLSVEHIRPLGGQDRALAEALRAWALQELGRPSPHPDLVGVLGETNTDAVKKYWPEFAAFLERAAANV